MRILQLSSGDFVADRRAGYAAMFAASGEHGAAAELMQQALDLAPEWPAGWCLLGDYRVEAGDVAGAVAAYRELARRDAEGWFGAVLKLAALGAAPLPRGTEVLYVEALFDDYAERFEAELVIGLDYRGPAGLSALIGAELDRRGVEQVGHALDLGCGTGLMGERLRRSASFMEGVDLSAAMLAEAERKGIYDRLEKSELTAFLAGHIGGLDLVAAADVLNYCGALSPVLSAVASRLVPGGLFAFTLEQHDGPEPLVLNTSLRYAHSPAATRAALAEAGLEILAFEQTPLRRDRNAILPGLLVLARRPSPTLALDPSPSELSGIVPFSARRRRVQ